MHRFSHRSAVTFLDRSGLSENHQGGQNGWGHTSDANSEFTRKLWRAKKFRAVSSVVERLVYTERVGGSKPSPPNSQ